MLVVFWSRLRTGELNCLKSGYVRTSTKLRIAFITRNKTSELTLQPDYEVHDGIRLKQFPICLAYALTIDKVQEMILNNLIVGGIDRFATCNYCMIFNSFRFIPTMAYILIIINIVFYIKLTLLAKRFWMFAFNLFIIFPFRPGHKVTMYGTVCTTPPAFCIQFS